jgi:hypothetical protein
MSRVDDETFISVRFIGRDVVRLYAGYVVAFCWPLSGALVRLIGPLRWKRWGYEEVPPVGSTVIAALRHPLPK